MKIPVPYRKKMPNGTLTPTYYVRYQKNGRRVTKSTGQTSESAAKAWIADNIVPILQAMNVEEAATRAATVVSNARVITLDDAWQEFLDQPRTRQPGADRLAFMQARWERFVEWAPCGDTNAVSPAIAQRYWQHVDAQAIAGDTKNGHISICQRVLGACGSKAFDGLPKWQRKSVQRHIFTPEQLQEIGQSKHRMQPLFAFALHTGLREGDIATLRWFAIDMKGGWITIVQGKTGNAVRLPFIGPVRAILERRQGNGSEFVFPEYQKDYASDTLSYFSRRFLESLTSIQADKRLALNSKTGKRHTTVKPAGRDREVSVLDVHSCRHTFAYLAEQAGVPLSVIQSIVGHRTQRMTEHYTNHADDAAKLQHLSQLSAFDDATANPLAGFSDAELIAELKRRGAAAGVAGVAGVA